MSREEQEANDAAAARDLEFQIEDVRRRLSDWRIEWRGKTPPLPAVAERAALEDELRDLRLARQVEPTPEAVQGQVMRMWEMISRIEKNELPELKRRLTALEEQLQTWFAQDARDRRAGWRIANFYRAGVVALVVVDILIRVFR